MHQRRGGSTRTSFPRFSICAIAQAFSICAYVYRTGLCRVSMWTPGICMSSCFPFPMPSYHRPEGRRPRGRAAFADGGLDERVILVTVAGPGGSEPGDDLLAAPLGRSLSGSVVTLDGARDNWFGPWPPLSLLDDDGVVPTEQRRPRA